MEKIIPELYIRPSCELVIRANDSILYAHIEDNPSAKAFCQKLSLPLAIDLFADGKSAKIGSLPWSLPQSDAKIAIRPGDILLEDESKILLSFDECDRIATRIARIGKGTKEEVFELFGGGDVRIEFSLEWGE